MASKAIKKPYDPTWIEGAFYQANVSQSTPLDIPLGTYRSALLFGLLQGFGSALFVIYNNLNSVSVTNVITGEAYTGSALTATKTSGGVRITTSTSAVSEFLVLRPN